MAFSKRTVYLLLVVTTGVLYFLYALSASENDFIHFYPINSLIRGDNATELESSPSPVVQVELEATPSISPVPAVVKPNITISSELPVAEKLISKTENVIRRIPPKPKISDYADQVKKTEVTNGVVLRKIYDSGFQLPSLHLCPDFGIKMQLAIFISSAPDHQDARAAIRQTWGHYGRRSDVMVAFLIGKTQNPKDMDNIVIENRLYNDIIQANFIDAYNNLTLKTVSLLEWVDNFCHKVKFILKTDDDMFINVHKILGFLSKHTKDTRKIYGRLAKKWKPIRNKNSKYFVAVQQYKNPVFPDFTTGPAYIMTSDIISELYKAALDKTYLKLEDVFTTGIVAQEHKIQRVHVNELYNRRVSLTACNVQRGMSIHMVKPFEQFDLWKKLLDGRSKC